MECEQERILKLREIENEVVKKGYHRIVGIDEAGRGPLAGPVVAAACFIPKHISIPGIDDSKKLSEEKREFLYSLITESPDIDYGIGEVPPETIDQINILQATILAMKMAISQLKVPPDFLLVDGMALDNDIPCLKVIKGDAKVYSIAAASIIAKVTRDRIMKEYHEKWPQYHFDQHKGYPTKNHRKAIEKHGMCSIHRTSFKLIAEGRCPYGTPCQRS